MVTAIRNNDFAPVEKASLALVDFSATWCGPCKMLSPVVDALSEKYTGKVAFFNADVDENDELAAKFGIMSVPSLILFRNGKKIDQHIGFAPAPQLQGWIDSHFA